MYVVFVTLNSMFLTRGKKENFFFTETEQHIHGNQYHTKFLSFLCIPLVDILGREGTNTSETEFSSRGITA